MGTPVLRCNRGSPRAYIESMTDGRNSSGLRDTPIPVLNYAKKQPRRMPWRVIFWTIGLLVAVAIIASNFVWGGGWRYCVSCARIESSSFVRVVGFEWPYDHRPEPGWIPAWIEKADGHRCTHSWRWCASRHESSLLWSVCYCGRMPAWYMLAQPDIAATKQRLFDHKLAQDPEFLNKLRSALAGLDPESRLFFDDLWIQSHELSNPTPASNP